MNVVGPTASDGPVFDAVRTTVPEVPGVIVGDDTVSAMSALGAAAMIEVGATVLFAVAGSLVVVVAEAEPPMIVPDEVAGTETVIATDVAAPVTMLPATVQVTVPLVSAQPDGSVAPSVTPDGGVYVNVVGPTASDGPSFVAVIVTVPDVPGVIVGDDTVVTTSADGVAAVTVVGATVLSPGAGSVLPVATEAEPPVSGPAGVDDGTETGIETERVRPLARRPEIVQVTVPEANVQPDGSVPSTTPAGGV